MFSLQTYKQKKYLLWKAVEILTATADNAQICQFTYNVQLHNFKTFLRIVIICLQTAAAESNKENWVCKFFFKNTEKTIIQY